MCCGAVTTPSAPAICCLCCSLWFAVWAMGKSALYRRQPWAPFLWAVRGEHAAEGLPDPPAGHARPQGRVGPNHAHQGRGAACGCQGNGRDAKEAERGHARVYPVLGAPYPDAGQVSQRRHSGHRGLHARAPPEVSQQHFQMTTTNFKIEDGRQQGRQRLGERLNDQMKGVVRFVFDSFCSRGAVRIRIRIQISH